MTESSRYTLTLEYGGNSRSIAGTIDTTVPPDSLVFHMITRLELQDALDRLLQGKPAKEAS